MSVRQNSFLSRIDEVELQRLFSYWVTKRRGQSVPRKSDIDPVELGSQALPKIFIYRHTDDDRFRCQLAGEAISTRMGAARAGQYLDEFLLPTAYPSRHKLFSRVLESGLPTYYQGFQIIKDREHVAVSRLLLPIASAAVADHVLGMVVYYSFEDSRKRMKAIPASGEPLLVVEATGDDLDKT